MWEGQSSSVHKRHDEEFEYLTFQVPGAAFPQPVQMLAALSVALEIRLGFPWLTSGDEVVSK